MRRSNLATIFYLAVVFVSGAVVGGFATRALTTVTAAAPKNHTEIRKRYIEDMRTRLHLTPPQVTQLQQIADSTGQQMHEARKTIGDQHVQKVIALLDENQKVEYAKMRAERDKAHQDQTKK